MLLPEYKRTYERVYKFNEDRELQPSQWEANQSLRLTEHSWADPRKYQHTRNKLRLAATWKYTLSARGSYWPTRKAVWALNALLPGSRAGVIRRAWQEMFKSEHTSQPQHPGLLCAGVTYEEPIEAFMEVWK